MAVSITAETLSGFFESVALVMMEKAEELCAMDAKMGDGDLGLTMRKGFCALPKILGEIEEDDMGKKLMRAGMKMAAVVPSTMGTLMASGIMNGGKAISGYEAMDAVVYLKYLTGFGEGIAKRGKCVRGDRTVLDAVMAAVDRLKEALDSDPSMTLEEAGKVALNGAKEGVEATRNMEPKFGKAAVHKAAAVGSVDQGACAALYMIQGYADCFSKSQ